MRCTVPAIAGFLFWTTLCGLAPTAPAPKLAYALIDVDRVYGQQLAAPASATAAAATRFAAAAMPATASPLQRAAAARPAPRAPIEAARRDGSAWHLSVNAGVTADSNVTNASEDRFLSFRQGDVTIPVELDPAFRARSGLGRGVSASAGVKLRLSDGAAIALDAEGQALDHKGGRNDDISFLLAAGPELTWSEGQSASVQLVAGDSWYGGTSVNRGAGVRVRYSTRIASGQTLSLFADGRSFTSGYGRDFGGEQAGAYLGVSSVLDPVTSASFGVFARREWLRAEEYSNVETGIYGGVSRYLGSMFTGSVSAGLSRTVYDAPLLYLDDKRRRDLRFNAGVSLTTRQPISMGMYPTIGYSYNRTDGSIDFFDADRHRVRFGVRRSF